MAKKKPDPGKSKNLIQNKIINKLNITYQVEKFN